MLPQPTTRTLLLINCCPNHFHRKRQPGSTLIFWYTGFKLLDLLFRSVFIHGENPMERLLPEVFSLSGRDVWVFGGAGHLGRPTVSLLSAAGANVLCVDLENRAEDFIQSVRLHGNVSPATCDATDVPALRQFVAAQIKRRGVPHGLVNLTFSSTSRRLE